MPRAASFGRQSAYQTLEAGRIDGEPRPRRTSVTPRRPRLRHIRVAPRPPGSRGRRRAIPARGGVSLHAPRHLRRVVLQGTFKSTDAAAHYDAYGDIVGGIGAYPVLSNPHYHQSHDLLEFENHELIAETSKTTVATLMMLASSPSRIGGLTAERVRQSVKVVWTPSPERSVTEAMAQRVKGPAPICGSARQARRPVENDREGGVRVRHR